MEIRQFAENKGFKGTLTGKVKCEHGEETHPLFSFLKSSVGSLLGSGLKWNFSKFLCNEEGIPVQRYLPTTSPLGIENDIKKLIETGTI